MISRMATRDKLAVMAGPATPEVLPEPGKTFDQYIIKVLPILGDEKGKFI
jgi:hypothetical protein